MIKYNIYKDKQLVAEDVDGKTVEEITGITKHNFYRYVGRTARNGYKIVQLTLEKEIVVDPLFQEKWDMIRAAAELLRNGGHIVIKNGKKYVEAVR